jgi:flavin reductase (DIM6/NTAB) family NADH-FMN oxidoreductase RutF
VSVGGGGTGAGSGGGAGAGRGGGTGAGEEGAGDIDDRLRRRVLWAMPTGLYVIGSRSGDRYNLMTANLCVQVSVEPKLVGVAIDVTALTARLVSEGQCFSVNLLAREDRALVRRFVKPVPESEVTAGPDGAAVAVAGEAVLVARTGAPILARAEAWLDCALHQRVALGSHDLFIGEVAAVGGPPGDLPPVLRMEDTRMNYGG